MTPATNALSDRLVSEDTARVRLSVSLWMAVAIAVITLVAYWDAQRESQAALSDFAAEQATLASAVSERDAEALEQRERRVLLVRGGALVTARGAPVSQAAIEDGLRRGASWVRLSREESAALGLPRRTSIAGMGKDVVVVTSAERERDREIRAQWRAVLGVVIASSLVLLFGGLAMRKQREELSLARELEVQKLVQERDHELRRADKMATLGALATGIAHEIATPLGVIQGRAEQLAPKVSGDERAARAVAAILGETKRIDEVIRGFLGLARGRAPTLTHADPARVAKAATGLVQHRFAKASVALEVTVEPELSRVACEPRLFEQALVNLLLNACEACEAGGRVALRVFARGGRVCFVVEDDGRGIEPEVAKRATEPFFTTKAHGTGLGLAIASEIVKHHNGSFAIEPGARGGSVASVELPEVTS